MEKKRNFTPLYLLINIGILAAIILLNPELKNIDEVLLLIDYRWVIMSIGFMVVFGFRYYHNLHIIGIALDRDMGF